MRRLAALVLVALAAACSDSPCQDLGERICRCQPGTSEDSCRTQVENQIDEFDPSEDYCEARLGQCSEPEGADFCEWLLTQEAKDACGLTPANPPQ